jgi:hypothetical protein
MWHAACAYRGSLALNSTVSISIVTICSSSCRVAVGAAKVMQTSGRYSELRTPTESHVPFKDRYPKVARISPTDYYDIRMSLLITVYIGQPA